MDVWVRFDRAGRRVVSFIGERNGVRAKPTRGTCPRQRYPP